jgi:primosomal protein N' (replication factor Y)
MPSPGSLAAISASADRVDRDPFADTGVRLCQTPTPVDPTRQLTGEQTAALDRFALAATGEFRAALLHGVTGSGKTEIYTASRRRSAPRAALMLVPETP